MSLDPKYIEYPRRQYGYDHDIYPWSAMHQRPAIKWDNDKKVAIWICVSLEYFPIIPNDAPFRAPGHMVTPYPDYRHYTSREYGTRIGIYRLLDAFKQRGIRASIAANSIIAEKYPALVEDILADGHEIIAHSTDMNASIASNMDEAQERAIIEQSLEILTKAIGEKPSGWLSISRSQSWRTADILTENGVKYCCDWVNDELPYRFNNGLINLPLNHEISDRQIISVQQQSANNYAASMMDAFHWLHGEAAQFGGRLLPLHITPYIMGLPYRIGSFENMLDNLLMQDSGFFTRGDDLVRIWEKQQ
ncbi:polysaccharide deacetylase [Sphingorhabdus lutea]|uniref:Chitooligosaccharide deacetylase n=1 Tax=Sphingorhabdus lutea TaxID=1913578 RepID=A0A1L3J992_9SPHN|nr:polysaccharide deacetylase family protein [Sphingorhabdus lutea]APG61663.1 polysaccharide deacetylase [Sphingorhabdus lutea]